MKYAVIPLRAAIDSNAMLGLLLLDLLNVTQRTRHCWACVLGFAQRGLLDLTRFVCCVLRRRK